MRNTLCSVAVLAVALSACGGKILDDGRAASTGAPPADDFGNGTNRTSDEQDPVAMPPPGLQQPTKASVEDACAAMCERNGRCGAWQPDCKEQCADDLRASSPCAVQAGAYIHCYADNIEGCGQVPPVCEQAYCAFRSCQGKIGPSYCR